MSIFECARCNQMTYSASAGSVGACLRCGSTRQRVIDKPDRLWHLSDQLADGPAAGWRFAGRQVGVPAPPATGCGV